MSRESLQKQRLEQYVSMEDQFNFPEFLRLIRTSLGLTRLVASQDLGLSKMRLYALEYGKFRRVPEIEHLARLAEYYGVSSRLLQRKAAEYMLQPKDKPKQQRIRQAA